MPKYYFFPIILIIAIFYIFTYILCQRRIIARSTHRRIWNIILLIAFLISGGLGLLLVIQINYGRVLGLPFNILYWHVEIGIVMAVISILHIAWHWQYYTSIFKRKK